jgi:hypothetical protein
VEKSLVDGANFVPGSVIDENLMTQGEKLGLDEKDRLAPFVIHIIGIRPGKHPLFDE